jgi:hypothetical protein
MINFWDIKLKILSWSSNSGVPGQTEWMCRLAWLYTGGQRRITFGSSMLWVKDIIEIF